MFIKDWTGYFLTSRALFQRNVTLERQGYMEGGIKPMLAIKEPSQKF